MLNMNRVTLLGRAGRDPEIRTLANGGRAASFALATNERWKDRDGRNAEHTEWHRVVVYGATVEPVERLVRKGAAILVEGRLATRGYRDRDGHEKSVTEIVVAGPQGVVNVLSGGQAPAEREQQAEPEQPAGADESGADPSGRART